MFYAALLILLGFGFYMLGLFATPLLSWSGVLLIGLGLVSIIIHPDFSMLKYLAASVTGLGLPMLALLLHHQQWTVTVSRRMLAMFAWLLVCLAPVGLAYGMSQKQDTTHANALTLEQYRHMDESTEPVTVALPPGTVIPMNIEIEGKIFNTDSPVIVPLTLAKTLYISVVDKPKSEGQPYGKKWRVLDQYIKTTQVKAQSFINAARQPEASVSLKLELFKKK